MKTYSQWLREYGDNLPHGIGGCNLARLAYKVSQGEFRSVVFTTPTDLSRELSEMFLLSENTEKMITLSMFRYIEYVTQELSK